MIRTFAHLSRSVSKPVKNAAFIRTFLCHSYYCNEVWEKRLTSPIIQKIKPDDFYFDLDQAYQKSKNLSSIDVDIFANSINKEGSTDELLDIVHKLRLSADTCNTLDSTGHAVIRYLLFTNDTELLLSALDDRLNYGIFLDNFSANILLDTFWKKKDYTSGARIASQIMLQEDFCHPLTTALSLLHCYKFLLNPVGWPEPQLPEEPTEEIKVRFKFLRNDFFDDHFDLRDPKLIVGKTISMICSAPKNSQERTLKILGLAFYQKNESAMELIQEYYNKKLSIITKVIEMLPEDNAIRTEAKKLSADNATNDRDLSECLINEVKRVEKECSEKDIADQCKIYTQWEQAREEALQKQMRRLDVANRLKNVEESKIKLQDQETKLWFFENEEKLELEADGKKIFYPKRWFGKKKKPRKIDEGYIPPEVQKKIA